MPLIIDNRPAPGTSPAASLAAHADAVASEAVKNGSSTSWAGAAQAQRDAAVAWRETGHPDAAQWHEEWAGRFDQRASAQPDHQQEAQR